MTDARALCTKVCDAGYTPIVPLEDKWYDVAGKRAGHRQFVIADPDGYLLRFSEDLDRFATRAWRIRRAVDADSLAAANVWLRSRQHSAPAIPLPVHNDDDVRAWFAECVIPQQDAWVVEGANGDIYGVLIMQDSWIEQLYVDPSYVNLGIGSHLIEVAKSQQPEGLDLWTFVSNAHAQRFYERHGFRRIRTRDGSQNEEGSPDVHYQWRAADDSPPRATARR